jgi:hypothetical protein
MTAGSDPLAELAGQLADLRERLEQLAEVVAQVVAAPADTVDTVDAADGACAAPGPGPGGGPAWCWATLTGEEAALAWATLIGWVDWLTARYQLEEAVPACWYRHGALVEELTALRAGWQAAYADPRARPSEPALWHDLLARTLARIRDWDRQGCAAGTHRDDEPLPTEPEVLADRAAYVRADLAGRDGLVPAFSPPQLVL